MTAQKDLSDIYAELRELKKQVRILSTAAPLGNSSITSGGLRVASPEGLVVQAVAGGIAMRVTGTEVVDGTLRVTGTFEITGQTDLTGDVDITGPLTVAGSTQITGPLTVAGATDITGDVDLTGDLNVVSSGRIKVGGMTLDPSTNGGQVDFGSSRSINVTGAAFGIYNGAASSLVMNSTSASLIGSGCSFVAGSAPRVVGAPTIPRASANNAVVGTAWFDTSGNLYRVVL